MDENKLPVKARFYVCPGKSADRARNRMGTVTGKMPNA